MSRIASLIGKNSKGGWDHIDQGENIASLKADFKKLVLEGDKGDFDEIILMSTAGQMKRKKLRVATEKTVTRRYSYSPEKGEKDPNMSPEQKAAELKLEKEKKEIVKSQKEADKKALAEIAATEKAEKVAEKKALTDKAAAEKSEQESADADKKAAEKAADDAVKSADGRGG